MTIATYADLQDQVLKFLLRDNSDLVVTTDQIKNYIALAESELSRELKIALQQYPTTIVTVATVQYAALPSDFMEAISLYFADSPVELCYVTPEEWRRKYTAVSGRPEVYTLIGSRIYFGGTPDAVYTFNLDYYRKIQALTDSNTTNDILTNYPDIYLYGALKHALTQIGDMEKLQVIAEIFNGNVTRVLAADQFRKLPAGSRMRPRTGAIGG